MSIQEIYWKNSWDQSLHKGGNETGLGKGRTWLQQIQTQLRWFPTPPQPQGLWSLNDPSENEKYRTVYLCIEKYWNEKYRTLYLLNDIHKMKASPGRDMTLDNVDLCQGTSRKRLRTEGHLLVPPPAAVKYFFISKGKFRQHIQNPCLTFTAIFFPSPHELTYNCPRQSMNFLLHNLTHILFSHSLRPRSNWEFRDLEFQTD